MNIYLKSTSLLFLSCPFVPISHVKSRLSVQQIQDKQISIEQIYIFLPSPNLSCF